MNDDADVFAISGILALSFALGLVALLGSTNVWIASLTVLALPVIAIVLTIAISKPITRLRHGFTQPSVKSRKDGLREGTELSGTDFTRSWLGKRSDFTRSWLSKAEPGS